MNRIEVNQLSFEDLRNMIVEVLNQEIPKLLIQYIKTPEDEVLLTRKEVAELLRISIPTLSNYTKSGIRLI